MGLLDLLFPALCLGCRRPGRQVCATCRAGIDVPARLAWPTPTPSGLPPPWAVLAYSGLCRDLILGYKERGALGLRTALAAPLVAALAAAAGGDGGPVVAVPIPSSRVAIRERGGDRIAELTRVAAALARRRGLAVRVVPALAHVRAVRDSAGLGATDRAANLHGAFAVRPRWRAGLAGHQVVLVDDLITTGATLVEASRALRELGVPVLAAAAVAATTRHGTAGRLGTAGLLGATANGATVGANRGNSVRV